MDYSGAAPFFSPRAENTLNNFIDVSRSVSRTAPAKNVLELLPS